MAKLVGTGKDPLGRYPEGVVYDIPDAPGDDARVLEDHLDKGWGELVDPKQHPGRTRVQIANAMVRGDSLDDPVEQELAEEIGNDAYGIVHTGDPGATAQDAQPELNRDDPRYRSPLGGRRAWDEDYTMGPQANAPDEGRQITATEAGLTGDSNIVKDHAARVKAGAKDQAEGHEATGADPGAARQQQGGGGQRRGSGSSDSSSEKKQ